MPSRTEFQQLADVRVAEATALLAAGHWNGAYYLAGYAVEFGLKACIARLMRAEDYPPHRKRIDDYFTHDIARLVKTAKLETDHATTVKGDAAFADNWNLVKLWTEESRYERTSETDARDLFVAVTDNAHGVLTWIKRHW